MNKFVYLVVLVIYLFAFPLSAFQSHDGPLIAGDKNWGITLEPSFGYLYGEAREIVYDTSDISTEGKESSVGTYISELVWDLHNIFYTGATVSFNYQNKIYLNTGFWFSVNSGSGFMNDYDWVYYNSVESRPYYLHDRDGKNDLSHWSLSEVDVLESYIWDINVSYNFLKSYEHKLTALIGFKTLYWNWNDETVDSYYDGEEDYVEVGINGIDYQLGIFIPYLGTGYGFNIKRFSFSGILSYSPFVFAYDHDHHINRTDYGTDGAHFYDIISFGQYVSLSIEVAYRFSRLFQLSGEISGEYLFETKGDTSIYSTSGGSEEYSGTSTGGAGIQYESISFSINAGFSF